MTRTSLPSVRRLLTAGLLAGALVVAVPGAARAHVTIQPGTAEGGSFSVVAFRVPNERDDAATTRVKVVLPEDQPIGFVQTTPVPGWRVSTATRTLEEPLELFGEQIDEVVGSITWTATGGGVRPGEFEDFEVSMGPLPSSGEMSFIALQTYSGGERVAWNEVVADGEEEAEHPAPLLTLTAAASDTTAGTNSGTSSDNAGNDGTPVLPLLLSGVAVLLAAAALVLSALRRRSAA